MSKAYYTKTKSINKKFLVRLTGLLLAFIGIVVTAYVFAPLILWQIFLAPVFASQGVVIPIPKTIFLTPASIQSLLSSQASALGGIDYNKATNWFPGYTYKNINARIAAYTLSIPRLGI